MADNSRNDTLAALSYELRVLLNAVLGWTRMLRSGAVPPERTTAILETIERNAAAQMRIAEQLLLLAATPAAPDGPRPEDACDASLRGRRVLAVDDDESTQELVATMLLMYGVSVRTAGRAMQAIDLVREWRPDVLLADIAMPGEDGYALVQRVRALPPPLGAIPAVALTAWTDAASVQRAFAAGFDAHVGKPLEPHVLADTLTKVLRTRARR